MRAGTKALKTPPRTPCSSPRERPPVWKSSEVENLCPGTGPPGAVESREGTGVDRLGGSGQLVLYTGVLVSYPADASCASRTTLGLESNLSTPSVWISSLPPGKRSWEMIALWDPFAAALSGWLGVSPPLSFGPTPRL